MVLLFIMKNSSVFIDLENISKDTIYNIISFLDLELNNTNILCIKAYYNVNNIKDLDTIKNLLKHGINIVHVETVSRKNSCDIKLIVDLLDMVYRGNCDEFYIWTSDSDYKHISPIMKEMDKSLYFISDQKNKMLEKNCNNYFITKVNISKSIMEDKIVDIEQPKKKRKRKSKKKDNVNSII